MPTLVTLVEIPFGSDDWAISTPATRKTVREPGGTPARKDVVRQKEAAVDESAFLHPLTRKYAFSKLSKKDRENNRGNFLNTVQLLRDFDNEFDQQCKDAPKNATYLSATIQNDMIESLAIAVKKAIIEDVGGSVWSILGDECEDVANHEQMGIGIRYTNAKGVTKETFIGIVLYNSYMY